MIGVFDSGYGGLTVLKSLLEKLPEYDYIYLGDNARTPYGTRSAETVLRYSKQAIDFLFDQGAVLIIIACNTVSALALRSIQQEYLRDKNVKDKKILGVIRPLVECAADVTLNKKISVVGTRGTVQSGSYEEELKHIDPEIKVYSKACPLLVPLIEENWHNKPEAKSILKKYLHQLKTVHADTMILGCTHYPLMYKQFKSIMGKKVNVLDSGNIVAESLKEYLKRHPEIETLLSRHKIRKYLTTDCPDRFKEFANTQLKLKIKEVNSTSL